MNEKMYEICRKKIDTQVCENRNCRRKESGHRWFVRKIIMEKKIHKAEGDINISQFRNEWQEKNLIEETKKDLIEDHNYFLEQALSTPCLDTAEKVEGVYIYDGNGRRIFDFHGNSVHQLGYNHPRLIQALWSQLNRLSFSPRRYANKMATECAKKICSLMPSEDYKVLFTTSGAVSNETALKLARRKTGKHKVLAAEDSFHGATYYTIGVGGTEHFRKGLEPFNDGVFHYPHYSSYQGEDPEGKKGIEFIENICKSEEIGALIAEPIRCTDVQIPPVEYWQKIRKICDEHNVALIFDEIPTALGRTGNMLAFERFGVTPDILTLGKGLGGSLIPFSAVVAHTSFDVCGDTSMGHFTHEKNPLGSAVAVALIEEIQEKNLTKRAEEIGLYIVKRAKDIDIKTNNIGDIRQAGALVGVELVKDKITKEKDVEKAEKVLYECFSKGLSFKVSCENVLTLSPPLTISDRELTEALDIFEQSMLHLV